MQCEEWADANSELFKEAHDETVHKNSYKRKLYELISTSLKLIAAKGGDTTALGSERPVKPSSSVGRPLISYETGLLSVKFYSVREFFQKQ